MSFWLNFVAIIPRQVFIKDKPLHTLDVRQEEEFHLKAIIWPIFYLVFFMSMYSACLNESKWLFKNLSIIISVTSWDSRSPYSLDVGKWVLKWGLLESNWKEMLSKWFEKKRRCKKERRAKMKGNIEGGLEQRGRNKIQGSLDCSLHYTSLLSY